MCVEACSDNTFGELFGEIKKCVQACSQDPYPLYGDLQTKTCKRCHGNCAACNGPSEFNCTSCISWLFFSNSSCVKACDPPLFGDKSQMKCIPKCNNLTFGHPSSRLCEKTCGLKNYFPNTTTRICDPCHENCQSCFGPKNTNCLSCRADFFYRILSKPTSQTENSIQEIMERITAGTFDIAELTKENAFQILCTSCEERNDFKNFENGKCEFCFDQDC